ncbi:extracellular solute-binding protein [Nordella sp. HKS 07]|uniref:extracellular solute-binding protein n=1 Tax=Nordella sp. HKS 07 TaxID=2712222 RepID=UPI0013E1E9FF|nr:extracellular solute-binding protein [Nordella sp. HKS 07]QIG47551.1 extracellular solute-binding protein [Nordella sp. HKS 07]
MKHGAVITGLTILLTAGPAFAEGQLNIYNWGNYTSPELIKKFEDTYKVKVTVTDFDSNDTALAKLKAGGHGFDIVVPSNSHVPIFIHEGVLLESRPDQMENFKNVDDRWVNVEWDKGRHYTVPWAWGSTGVIVNTKVYSGDPNTWKIIFDPPEELKGKINVLPEMLDTLGAAIKYNGGELCTDDKEILKKAHATLVAAKPNWLSMDYSNVEKYVKEDFAAGVNYSGAAFRARLQNDKLVYGYPKEGYSLWMDSAAIIKDAKNVDNAKLFLNFIMAPENAGLISSFTRYANGIKGSEAFMPEDMKTAPEVVIPADLQGPGKFDPVCSAEVQALYTRIWTDITK